MTDRNNVARLDDAARAAFLEHLQNEDFLPAENWNEEASKLELETFVSNYWKMAGAARRFRWNEIRSCFPHGRIAARLNHLEIGLAFSGATDHPDEKVRSLGELFRELFLLQPRSRTIRRHEWLAGVGNRESWLEVLGDLRIANPRIPELDPPLVAWIEQPQLKPAARARLVSYGSTWENFTWQKDLLFRDFTLNPEAREILLWNAKTAANGKKMGIGVAIILIFLFVIIGISIAVSNTEPLPKPTKLQRLLDYNNPYSPGGPGFPQEFSDAEVLSFYDYKIDSGQSVPPRYFQFLSSGGQAVLDDMKKNPDAVNTMRTRAIILKSLMSTKLAPTGSTKRTPTTRR